VNQQKNHYTWRSSLVKPYLFCLRFLTLKKLKKVAELTGNLVITRQGGEADMILRVLLIALSFGLLTGCSVLDSVDTSLNYANEATTYVNNAASFSEQLPSLAEQAVTDPEAKNSLLDELENMKNNIANFNAIEAPSFAEDIHQQLVDYNETLEQDIDGYLEKAKIDNISLDSLADSHILQTVDQITQTLNQIKQLGS
jgi:hypothetical protein